MSTSHKPKSEKRFLFIDLTINSFYYGVNHSIAFLVPVVKKNSFAVSVIRLDKEISAKKFKKMVEKINPTIVGFSSMQPQTGYLIKYSKAIADLPGILKIAGGVGPSLAPEETLLESAVDGVAVGEGEQILNELLIRINKGKDIYNTPGFYWKIGNQIKKNPIPHFLTDISSLDFPDYSVFKKSVVLREYGAIKVQISRGCPNNCTYCSNPALRSLYPSSQNWFRVPTVDYSIQFLKNLILQYPKSKFVVFNDELLTSNKEWFMDFGAKYSQTINLPCNLCIHPQTIDDDLVDTFKKMRCHFVWIGLESGDESIREKVMNRHYSNELFIEKCKMIKAAGIQVYTFSILGLPHETPKQMAKTLALNKLIQADNGHCSFFYPFPKTKLYEICQKDNLLLDREEMLKIDNYNTKPAIKLSPEIRQQCIAIQKEIIYYFMKQKQNSHLLKSWFFDYLINWYGLGPKVILEVLIPHYLYQIKLVWLKIDQLIGLGGIFIKNNFPKLYFFLKRYI